MEKIDKKATAYMISTFMDSDTDQMAITDAWKDGYTTRNEEVVKMVEEMIDDLDCVSIQSAFREFNDHAILQLKDLLTKLKEDKK